MEKLKAVALIPARKGSKGIPNKNFRIFCGKPLVSWSSMAAIKSKVFDKVIVSMDGGWDLVDWKSSDPNMLKDYNGVLQIDNKRPEELSTDEATLDDLLLYYRMKEENQDFETWCLLQPTSPLRTADDIKKAYRTVCSKKWDSVASVKNDSMIGWVDEAVKFGKSGKAPISLYNVRYRPNRQDRKHWLRETGSVYFCKYFVLDVMQSRIGGMVKLLQLPEENSFEIDTELDWKIAEFLMKERLNNGS